MRSKAIWTTACFAILMAAGSAAALEFREEPNRVGVVNVGDPILLDYSELTNEMNLNSELRDWIDAFGRPEYAEYQRIELNDPFLPYEIRLYYIEGRRYVAFGRVYVSPSLTDFGVRKYIGKLDSGTLQRLLTAEPLAPPHEMAAADHPTGAAYYERAGSPRDMEMAEPMPEDIPVGEEVVVEEVIEMPEAEEVVIVESAPDVQVMETADEVEGEGAAETEAVDEVGESR